MAHSKTAAVIVAAGRGTRAGGEVPKQWRRIAGSTMLSHTLARFHDHPRIDLSVLVLHPDDMTREISPAPDLRVAGGADRAASVRAGLEALADHGVGRVLIHDVARPCVSDRVIADVIDALDGAAGAAPAIAVTDALWTVGASRVTGTPSREGLFRAQTPQGFDFAAIRRAHAAHPGGAADDVEVARASGLEVAVVPGDEDNMKVTLPGDFARAAAILRRSGRGEMQIRLGNGFDVHAFGPGDHVTLCGVEIPHDRGLLGHSDADVAMHTVTDAIYGALALGDIGTHFPPSDMQWKGASSEIFLRHAVTAARDRGYEPGNVDCTIICETPKVGPHAPAMREKLAGIMEIGADRISVKATTSEGLGFTGRGEGIACMATCTLVGT